MFAWPFSVVLAAAFTAVLAAFGAIMFVTSDFRVCGPPVEVSACYLYCDLSFLVGSKVGRSCWAQFLPV